MLDSTQSIAFIKETFQQTPKELAVIAVSGGIDSAVSCTLLCQALGAKHVYPVFLSYGKQSIEDSQTLVVWCGIPQENWRKVNIAPVVDLLVKERGIARETESGRVRLGNIMARVRMIAVFDLAKELDALVCGTENKSEKYLGYFTRFGDGASDVEPIQHLYKTQVRALAADLGVPLQILKKAPSAELWQGQTDEAEFGFSYEDADHVLAAIVDQRPELLAQLVKSESDVDQLSREVVGMVSHSINHETMGKTQNEITNSVVTKILQRVKNQWFKQEVPYILTDLT